MRKTKIMSALLSLTLGMTSLAGVPVTVNAADDDTAAVTAEQKSPAPANETTNTTTVVTDTTTTVSDPNLRWDYYDFRGPNGNPNYRPDTTTTTTTTVTKNKNDVTTTTTAKKESSISFEEEEYTLAAGMEYQLKLNNPNNLHIDYKVEDQSVAEEKVLRYDYVYVDAYNAGTTKITATAENGETAEAVINVLYVVLATTPTTTSGTGTVTTTVTETTAAVSASTPAAFLRIDDEPRNMYINQNDTKDFKFDTAAVSSIRFTCDAEDLKFGCEFDESRQEGILTIGAASYAEPRSVDFYSYITSTYTLAEYKKKHSILIVPEGFTATTTSNPKGTTTTATRTTYVTADTQTDNGDKSSTTTAATLPNIPTTTIAYDYGTVVEYDANVMRVGETRKIRFYHPKTKKSESPSIGCSDTNISYTYNEGDDFITITALKEGKAELNIREKDCAFGNSVRFDVFAADADIITEVIAPDKIVYSKGEELDISGLKGIVEHADGSVETIDLSKIGKEELTVEELHTAEEFPTMDENKYNVRIGSRDQTEITVDGKKYGLNKSYRKSYLIPASSIGWFVYLGDNYVQIKNAKVVNCNMGTGAEGLEFKGIDRKFSIDADAQMHAEWCMASLNVGDIVSGVMWVNGNYVIAGDVETVWYGGDATCDGELNMADAVLIMQALANPDKYGEKGTDKNHITAQGTDNADTTDDGMTNADALAVQKKLLFLK